MRSEKCTFSTAKSWPKKNSRNSWRTRTYDRSAPGCTVYRFASYIPARLTERPSDRCVAVRVRKYERNTPRPSICITPIAQGSWIRLHRDNHTRPGHRCQHGNFQRSECGASATPRIERCGPAGAHLACAATGELSRDKNIFGICCELSRLAEAK